MSVVFVDTSILCNLLPVPGRDQDRERVLSEFETYSKPPWTMVLPVVTVIETGNHIAHLADGRMRRTAAQLFARVLERVRDGSAPWVPHEFRWDAGVVGRLIDGDSTGADLVHHAMRGMGAGDLSILVERDLFRARSMIETVRVWTSDRELQAYA